jgi:hypothetical protein
LVAAGKEKIASRRDLSEESVPTTFELGVERAAD